VFARCDTVAGHDRCPGFASTVALGRSGLVVGPLGWGMWRFAGTSLVAARERVDAAREPGRTLVGTADDYGLGTEDGFRAADSAGWRSLVRTATGCSRPRAASACPARERARSRSGTQADG
jgi:hypothetical protein